MKKRGPKPQFTLDDVLDAASDIIGDQGYPALSMSAVARTMGTSVSGLYRYVEGLEPLLVALQTRAIAGYCTGLTERLASFDEVNRNRKPTKKAALERVILTLVITRSTHAPFRRGIALFRLFCLPPPRYSAKPPHVKSTPRSVPSSTSGLLAFGRPVRAAPFVKATMSNGPTNYGPRCTGWTTSRSVTESFRHPCKAPN